MNKNKTFQIQSNKKLVRGKWILKDSVLYLIGNIKNKEKNKLKINSLTRASLILKPEGLKSEKALLKLVRVKRK